MLELTLLMASIGVGGDVPDAPLFHAPERLRGGEQLIQIEQPGYASPAFFDMDGDGLGDLLVGQFAGGKIKVYKNLGDGKFAPGEWLKAEGEVAEVPGVW